VNKQVRNCLLIPSLLVLLFLLGCTSLAPSGENSSSPEWTPSSPEGTSSSPEAFPSPIEVTDQLGRIVRLENIPQRIISLDPGNTEILFALGLGDKVVAVTDYCDYPDEAKEKPKVSGSDGVDMTKLAGFSPDLVLVTTSHKGVVIPELEQRGFTTFGLAPSNLDEALAAINLVGEITDQQDEASQLIAELQDRIEAVTDKIAAIPYDERPLVLYVAWHDPLIVAGSGTLADDLIQKAGGINIAQILTGYSEVSLDEVAEANPEVIFVSIDFTLWLAADLPFEYITTEWELRETDARLNERVYQIWDVLLERHGPRLVNGLEELSMLIYWRSE
jgi:iron complex transport system substrate-binding protein